MKEETSMQSCLTPEQLEELRCGAGTAEERQHLAQCSACQSKLHELEHLDALVAKAIQPPDGLSERILAAVRKQEQPIPRSRMKVLWGLTYAAAAAVVIMFSLAIWTYAPENDASLVAGPVQSVKSPTYEPRFIGKYARNSIRAMQASENANVKTVGSKTATPYATPLNAGVVFPSIVEQVWSVTDLDHGIEFLKQVAKVNQKEFDLRENEIFHEFAIALKDTEAQELADKLASYGWNLLSPSLPQPDSTENVMFTENPVIYKLKLVRAEK